MSNNSAVTQISQPLYYILLFLLAIVYTIGLFVPIMEIDAAQYASISLEMLHKNTFLTVTDLYKDYLDKPPLLFWISSLSIKIFGNTSLAYKLPSVLIGLFSWYGLYKITKYFYATSTARMAVLIYATTLSTLIMFNDIRTDTLLIGFVILAIWQMLEFIRSKSISSVIFTSIFLGAAMLSKGPIGVMVPILAVIPHLIFSGKLRTLLNYKLLLVPIVIFICLSPMLWGLYEQFGAHGIRFFFWEQSFGRITGENVWKNDASSFFFVHTLAWAILPWTVFFVAGCFKTFSKPEHISTFGFILPFIALSQSHYKLPHYIYIVIPFAAIIVALGIQFFWQNRQIILDRVLGSLQVVILFAFVLGSIAIITYVFPISKINLAAIAILALISLGLLFHFKSKTKPNLILASAFVFIWSAFVLNLHAYPSLLKHQSQSEVAFYLQENDIDIDDFYTYGTWGRTLNYYNGQAPLTFSKDKLKSSKATYVLIRENELTNFQRQYEIEETTTFSHMNVTRLSTKFLNPNTRTQTLEKRYLLKLKPIL